jgi:hypothetical protein
MSTLVATTGLWKVIKVSIRNSTRTDADATLPCHDTSNAQYYDTDFLDGI